MPIKILLNICCFLLLFFSCSSIKKSENTLIQKPNIIIILADDLGWADTEPYGNKFIETPNLNKLAAEGIKFTKAYAAAPLCSPTRASIITGTNPARLNLTEHLHGYSPAPPTQKLITPRIANGLPTETTTIPEALKASGYQTAHFGKWHLGSGKSSPKENGFDTVYGGGAEGLPMSFFYPFFNGKPYPDLLADTKEGDYLDDALTNKTINYIGSQKDQPFFLELNFYSPHVPIEGKKSLVEKYEAKKRQLKTLFPEPEYAAMVENIDYNVGRLISFLKENGLDKNTIVIFTSDNGGLNVQEVPAFAKYTPPTTNKPLKGGKGYLYEGGIREPFIFWSPGMGLKARTEKKAIISSDDIFNTCMQLANNTQKSPDGRSFVDILKGGKQPLRTLFWHFPHYSPQRGLPGAIALKGRYKLIEWYETGQTELFNLDIDEGEQNNIASQKPDLVKTLKAELTLWKKSVNAQPAILNPAYKPAK